MIDRRSGAERRRSERIQVTVDIEWENHSGRYHGTLSDISHDGCFVLAGGDFADGERIFVHIPMDDGSNAAFSGSISNHVYEIGFAVRFDPLTDEQERFLERFVAFYSTGLSRP